MICYVVAMQRTSLTRRPSFGKDHIDHAIHPEPSSRCDMTFIIVLIGLDAKVGMVVA
jgi:hypothetical protein